MNNRKQPTQARSRQRVQKIISATRELATTAEISNITTSSIAKAAGVPVGSVYQYFEDKNDVLLAVAEQLVNEQDQKLQELYAEISSHAHWRHIVKAVQQAFIRINSEDILYQRLSRALSWTKEWDQMNSRSTNKMVEFFANYGLLTERGFSPAEARNIVRVIVTLTSSLSRAAHELPTKEEADRLLEEMPKMTIAYLATILGD
ncbi:TetR/AcrR family transcriptional regulator [Sneathiella limimaris]|uniref:TetR/AcrR family transcriptional regulator n=1 Tax=Sneathiella limimaris TaxID=1964213 RepID=UPI00146EB862|nr:TetR/AcrR family transcriptional regulator [Sneathiella limimaris]